VQDDFSVTAERFMSKTPMTVIDAVDGSSTGT
jgi:hypothetical protein